MNKKSLSLNELANPNKWENNVWMKYHNESNTSGTAGGLKYVNRSKRL